MFPALRYICKIMGVILPLVSIISTIHHVLAGSDTCHSRDLAYVTMEDYDWLCSCEHVGTSTTISSPVVSYFRTVCFRDPSFWSVTLLCSWKNCRAGLQWDTRWAMESDVSRVDVTECSLEHLFYTLSSIRAWRDQSKVLSNQCRGAKCCNLRILVIFKTHTEA